MNREKRDMAVRAFMTNKKARVLLMSLKCGGVGLVRFCVDLLLQFNAHVEYIIK